MKIIEIVKTTIYIFLILYIGMILYYFLTVYSYLLNPFYYFEESLNSTPVGYKYEGTVPDSTYKSDSVEIHGILLSYITLRKYSFKSDQTGYDDDTEILIDTIVYSPSKDRMAVLVASKISNKKLDPPPSQRYRYPPDGFTFDGFCYLGIKDGDGRIRLRFFDFRRASGFDSQTTISRYFHKTYFIELGTSSRKMEDMRNIDDERFWSLNLWDELFKEEDK